MKSKKYSSSSPTHTKTSQPRKKASFPAKTCAKPWCTSTLIPNTPTPKPDILYIPLTSNRALGLPPNDSTELANILSALDPTLTGQVPYSPFVSVCAAKLRSRDDDAMVAEVDDAYQLFTRGGNGPISLNHLRRIARELKEDSVGDELLKDMILEANGGAGLSAGVTLEQFHDVMTRAGVF
jgi:Ca2+-binding EF-hand superfamily protein